MKIQGLVLAAAVLVAFPTVSRADSAPFGAASEFNLFAIGTGTTANPILAGTVSSSSDVNGRIAAANKILGNVTVAQTLVNDPYGTTSDYFAVSNLGLNAGSTISVLNNGKHGNVYAPGTDGNVTFNAPGSGTRVTTGSSPINFDTLRSSLDNETAFLGALGTTGQALGTNSGHGNPSNYVLYGTNSTLNVFNIDASVLNDSSHPLSIYTPAGSTTIINVHGTSVTLSGSLFYNESQNTGDSNGSSNVLFNFPDATSVALNAQFSAALLAPYAVLTGSSQINGEFIAAQIAVTGEVHNDEFTGHLPPSPPSTPPVPEPGTLALVGTGVLSVAGAVRRRKKVTPLT